MTVGIAEKRFQICRELQTYTIFDCDLNKTKEAMKRLGFTYIGISNKKGSKRPTIEQFAKEHPKGRYIVSVAHHAVAVVDGYYYDTWDSGKKSLYGYYELQKPCDMVGACTGMNCPKVIQCPCK